MSAEHDQPPDSTSPNSARTPTEPAPDRVDAATDDMPTLSLTGRRLIVGVCGGIACYKAADVVSRLVQSGGSVSVVMTHEATRFVTPLTFATLTGRAVRTDAFDTTDATDTQHIKLSEQADLMLIVPATTNMIAKVSNGLTDDLISLMICADSCPVVFAPAMNNRMWENPIAQENYQRLVGFGYKFIGPDAGWLACRNVGRGRLADPAEIVAAVVDLLRAKIA